MKEGRILHHLSLDDFREKFIWLRLTNFKNNLPEKLPFELILTCKRDNRQAILTIDSKHLGTIARQAEKMKCQIETQYLPLEDIYKTIIGSQVQEYPGL